MKFFSFILAAGAAVSASAHNYTRCSNEYVAPEEIAELNSIVSEAGASGRFAAAAANIRVYAHVVTTEASRGRYTQSQINEQISVSATARNKDQQADRSQILNAAYVPLEYTFTLVSTDFTVNNAWARASLNTAAERNLKTALKRGTYGELDLYFLSDIPSGGLGWATFPVANPSSSQLILDGAVNLAGSLPRGDAAPFNLGATAVHEVGHWTGRKFMFGFHDMLCELIDIMQYSTSSRGSHALAQVRY